MTIRLRCPDCGGPLVAHELARYHHRAALAYEYRCPVGEANDRDLNAARNLAAFGERLRRPGLPVELLGLPGTVKQECGR